MTPVRDYRRVEAVSDVALLSPRPEIVEVDEDSMVEQALALSLAPQPDAARKSQLDAAFMWGKSVPAWIDNVVRDNTRYLKHLERRTSALYRDALTTTFLCAHPEVASALNAPGEASEYVVVDAASAAAELPVSQVRCSFCADAVIGDARQLAAHEAVCHFKQFSISSCGLCGTAVVPSAPVATIFHASHVCHSCVCSSSDELPRFARLVASQVPGFTPVACTKVVTGDEAENASFVLSLENGDATEVRTVHAGVAPEMEPASVTALVTALRAAGFPVPALVAGVGGATPFLVVEYSGGVSLAAVWQLLSADARRAYLQQICEVVYAVATKLPETLNGSVLGPMGARLQPASTDPALPSAPSVAAAAAAVESYYASALDAMVVKLMTMDEPACSSLAQRLSVYRNNVLPTLFTAAADAVVTAVSLGRLSLADVTVDVASSRVTAVYGWAFAEVQPAPRIVSRLTDAFELSTEEAVVVADWFASKSFLSSPALTQLEGIVNLTRQCCDGDTSVAGDIEDAVKTASTS